MSNINNDYNYKAVVKMINELPKDWKWVKLGDVCEKMSNGANAKQSNDKIGFPISRIETIWNETIDLGRVKYIEENDVAFVEKYSLKKDDILFSHINSDIHLGKTAIFKNQTSTLIHGINLLLIRLNKEALADFFNYQFKYKRRRGEFISIAQKSVNQSSINQPKLKNIDFVLPPLTTQQAIVTKIEELFSELDKGIENLRTAQQQLKTYRQSVLKWAFEGKLSESGCGELKNEQDYIKKEILQSSNSENSASDKGELPKGWKWIKLGTIAKKKSLKALPKDYPDAKFIGMDCIEPHTLKPFFLYDFKEFKSAGNVFKANQVLYGRMRPYLNKVYKAEFDGTCSGEFIILDCENNYNPDLLKYILHSKDFVSFANRITTGDRPRISYEEISDYDIPLAPLEEQHQIVQAIESRLSVADKLEESITQSLQQSEALRQSILKKAFEGRLVTIKK